MQKSMQLVFPLCYLLFKHKLINHSFFDGNLEQADVISCHNQYVLGPEELSRTLLEGFKHGLVNTGLTRNNQKIITANRKSLSILDLYVHCRLKSQEFQQFR